MKLFKILFLVCFYVSYSQTRIGISGKVMDSQTQKPLFHAVVSLQNTKQTQFTLANGTFYFADPPTGNQLLLIHTDGYSDVLLSIQFEMGQQIDLGTIALENDLRLEQQLNTILIADEDLNTDNSSVQNTSGLLQATRDVFQQAAAFNWGQARFRIRGLDSENATLLINGLEMNKMSDGRPQWNNWGGLNDATRNQEFTLGTGPSDYAFGGILGTQEINTQASTYKPGTRISFSGTNTNYSWRTMATYASGMNQQGWAFVVSAGKRYANEAFFEGTNYDGNSVFISVEKKLNNQQSLNFTGFYTPNVRGKNGPNTDEVTQLTAQKYNPYWGYQEGKMRNSRIKKIEEPIFMLNHFFKINEVTTLNSGALFQFGTVANSNIDYQNANSPDPSYYKSLPSYYSSHYENDQGPFPGNFTPDYENAEKSKQQFLAQPQIDWSAMYKANQVPILDSNGTIIGYEPAKSHYILYEDIAADTKFAANTLLSSQINANTTVKAGISFAKVKSLNYQKVTDLLGGTYFDDIDVFYNGNQAQSDLNNPDRKVTVGQKYGYNYAVEALNANAFTQFEFEFQKINFYLAQTFVFTNYQREGLYKNGIYENNSFGKSEKMIFENFGFKGGFLVKISGKQAVTFNAAHLTKAPTIRNTFSNARLNNTTIEGLKSENYNSLDLTYTYRSPSFKTRLTGYFSLIKDQTKTSFFYAEGIFDDGAGYANTDAFVNQIVTDFDQKNLGIEWGAEYQISAILKVVGAAAFGHFTVDSNPTVSIINDANVTPENPNPIFDFGPAILKNYKQAGMPQQAYSMGLEYRDPKYWWLGVNANYLAGSYVDVSPIARTSIFFRNPTNGFPFPEATPERAKILLEQEQLAALFLLNLNGGKSWKFNKTFVGLFASINNVLDVSYRTGGYEQSRNANFRERDQDVSSGTPNFGNKYFQGYGRTYFVNLTVSF